MTYNITPHITEKSYRVADASNECPQYTFKVDPSLRKEQVSAFIEKTYKVNVETIKSVSIPGKSRRFKGIVGRTSDVKKMIVTLKKGQKISAFEIEQKEKDNNSEKDNK